MINDSQRTKLMAYAKEIQEYCDWITKGADEYDDKLCKECIFNTKLGCAFIDGIGKEINSPAEWWI